jgi:hypothetical protein
MQALFPNSRIVTTLSAMPLEYLACIVDKQERFDVAELGAKAGMATLYIVDTDSNKLMAYAVLSKNDDGAELMIMRARSYLTGLGKMALAGLFKGAQAVSMPITVHAHSLRGFAKMMGADEVLSYIDTDGVSMGTFDGQ